MPLFRRSERKIEAVRTNYTSTPVDLPQSFLAGPPPAALSISRIDFANSPLPEYNGLYATVIDDAFTPDECATMITLAEQSAEGHGGWRKAMVNLGPNCEVLDTSYRNSDRIIWDNEDLMGRVWERCLCAPGLRGEMGVVEGDSAVLGGKTDTQKWVFKKPNERMRFLRYGKGQFFASHCDGSYVNPDPSKRERTLFTIQVYLNGGDVKGGATTFLSSNEDRKIDVEPKCGRVLIFQHRRLYHHGAKVDKGMKYTMRSDLMYERVDEGANSQWW